MRKGYLALASLALLVLVPGCKDKEKVKPRHIPRRPTAAKHEISPQPTATHTKALKKEDHAKKGHDGVINRNRRLKKETAKLASAETPVTAMAAAQEPAKKHVKKQHKVKKEKVKKEKKAKQPKVRKERIKKEKKAKQPKAKKEKKQHKYGKKHEAKEKIALAAADVMPTMLPTEITTPEEKALPVAPEETTPLMKKTVVEEQGMPATESSEAIEKTVTSEPEEPVIAIDEEEEEDLLSAVPEMNTPAVAPATTEPAPTPVTEEKVSMRLIK